MSKFVHLCSGGLMALTLAAGCSGSSTNTITKEEQQKVQQQAAAKQAEIMQQNAAQGGKMPSAPGGAAPSPGEMSSRMNQEMGKMMPQGRPGQQGPAPAGGPANTPKQ